MNLKVSEALELAEDFLRKRNISKPEIDGEVIMRSLLRFNRAKLYANLERELLVYEFESYRELIERRGEREPTQYIIETQEFWSLDLKVNRNVLIPRPETEILIERILALGLDKRGEKNPLRVLDIGTGCGNIAISLASELKTAKIIATDISLDALKLAKFNAWRHHVDDRIEFMLADLLKPFCKPASLSGAEKNKFDLIVSNPPYIPSEQLNKLSPEVSRWEPRVALDGGIDGLDFYRKIIKEAGNCLYKNSFLLLEIGEDQGEKIKEIIEESNIYKGFKIHKDYSGKNRVAEICKR